LKKGEQKREERINISVQKKFHFYNNLGLESIRNRDPFESSKAYKRAMRVLIALHSKEIDTQGGRNKDNDSLLIKQNEIYEFTFKLF